MPLQIRRYKIWFNKGWHCMGFIGRVGRKRMITQFGDKIGGFRNYWLWRFTLTIFQNKA